MKEFPRHHEIVDLEDLVKNGYSDSGQQFAGMRIFRNKNYMLLADHENGKYRILYRLKVEQDLGVEIKNKYGGPQ
jgi:hypothetical protein